MSVPTPRLSVATASGSTPRNRKGCLPEYLGSVGTLRDRMPGNKIHYGIKGMRRAGDQKQEQNQAPKQPLTDLGKEMYPDKRPNQDRRQHFNKVRDEVATNQTFGQQKSQRANLQHHNEHLHGASLFFRRSSQPWLRPTVLFFAASVGAAATDSSSNRRERDRKQTETRPDWPAEGAKRLTASRSGHQR
jgi:hypothetical protein